MNIERYEVYLNRMRSLKTRVLSETKYKHHIHHIVPKFMGGTDDDENKVKLTIEEHIEAHLELADCFPLGSDYRNKNLSSANVTKVWSNKQDLDIDLSGENNPMWNKSHSEETKRKIGEKSSKKHYSKEYRKKLSMASSGKNNPMWGRKHSDETKRKISETQIGDKHYWFGKNRSEETKRKISQSQQNKVSVVKCDDNGNILEKYSSIHEASNKNGISQSNLTTYLKKEPITKYGKPRLLGGYIWKRE
jgi:hypothetical protein